MRLASPNQQPPLNPVDVIQTEFGHLFGLQRQTRQEHQDGAIAESNGGLLVTGIDEASDLLV